MAENTFAVTQTPIGRRRAWTWSTAIELEQKRFAQPVERDHPHAPIASRAGRPSPTPRRRSWMMREHLPERHVGQVAVKSDCMLSDYYRRPDLQPIQDGWYRTGDIGYMADGEVFIIGRRKDLIIIAGKNIYPQDIEAIVNTFPACIRAGR